MFAAPRRAIAAFLVLAGMAGPGHADEWARLEMVFRTAVPTADVVAEVFQERLADRPATPKIQVSGADVRVSFITQQSAEDIVSYLNQRGVIGFHKVVAAAADCGAVPAGAICFEKSDLYPHAWHVERAAFGNDAIEDATPASGIDGFPVVQVRLTNNAAKEFGVFTAELVGEQIAVVIDDAVLTAPMIQSAIYGGSLQISGDFDAASASNLAGILSTRDLPAPVELVSIDASPSDPPKRSLTERLLGIFD